MREEDIRIDVVLIPSEPQFSKIIQISKSITENYENFNIIDANRFPPHLSLHIGNIPKKSALDIYPFEGKSNDILKIENKCIIN